MKKRIAINSFFNVFSHFVRMFISLFMTPYLLSKLGKEVYGILPLVNSIIAFLVLASGGIQNSVGRYATLNLAQNNKENANRYINTAFFMLVSMFCISLIPFILVVIFLPDLLNLPIGHEFESQIVFLILGFNLIVSMLCSPLTIGIYFKQRYELRNIISIAGQLFYVFLVICAFYFFHPNLIFISIATLIITLISSLSSIMISKRLVPSIRFSMSYFDKTKIREIVSYSFWTLVIQATVLIFLNTDYIIINKCIGLTAVTDYSLVGRFNSMLRAVITAAVVVIAPACTQLEADGAFDKIRTIFKRGLRIVILLVIPPSFLLCIFSRELLITWLGIEFINISFLFWVILLPQVLILGAMPSNAILGGLGKVKWVGIANMVGAFSNLIMSLVFVLMFNMGVMGVALASSIVISLKNFIFVPVYASYIVKEPAISYYKAFFKPLISAVPMTLIAFYIQIHFNITGWIPLLGASALCTAIYGITAYFIAFEESDRNDFKEIFSRSMAMFKPAGDR